MRSAKTEDYRKAVYDLQREEEEGLVSTFDVAALLDVTPPTATGMMEKVAEPGLAEREKYKRATASDANGVA